MHFSMIASLLTCSLSTLTFAMPTDPFGDVKGTSGSGGPLEDKPVRIGRVPGEIKPGGINIVLSSGGSYAGSESERILGQPPSAIPQANLPLASSGQEIAILYRIMRRIPEVQNRFGYGLILQVYAFDGAQWTTVRRQFDEAAIENAKWVVFHSDDEIPEIRDHTVLGSVPVAQIETYNGILNQALNTIEDLALTDLILGKERWTFAVTKAMSQMIQPIRDPSVEEE